MFSLHALLLFRCLTALVLVLLFTPGRAALDFCQVQDDCPPGLVCLSITGQAVSGMCPADESCLCGLTSSHSELENERGERQLAGESGVTTTTTSTSTTTTTSITAATTTTTTTTTTTSSKTDTSTASTTTSSQTATTSTFSTSTPTTTLTLTSSTSTTTRTTTTASTSSTTTTSNTASSTSSSITTTTTTTSTTSSTSTSLSSTTTSTSTYTSSSTTTSSTTFTSSTTTSSSTTTTTTTTTVETETVVKGVINLQVDDAEAFVADENSTWAIQETVAQVANVSSSYILVDLSISDLPPLPDEDTDQNASNETDNSSNDSSSEAATDGSRRLAGTLVRADFSILLPYDAYSDSVQTPAGMPSIEEISAALGSVSLSDLQNILVGFLDAASGKANNLTVAVISMEEHIVYLVTMTTTSTTVPCGNGVQESYELDDGRCDDGNVDSGDGCDSECYVEPGWYCETAGSPCVTRCGDGILVAGLEACDDGNDESCDGCSSVCQLESGRCMEQAKALCVRGYEPRSNLQKCDFCRTSVCRPSECCQLAKRAAATKVIVCGDGVQAGDEVDLGRCDDGNTVSGDGCDEACYVEPGWHCPEAGQPCTTECGDGQLAPGIEDCDDGNLVDFDGCSSSCNLELGSCSSQASSLCVGKWEEDPDLPKTKLCLGEECIVEECCRLTAEAYNDTAPGCAMTPSSYQRRACYGFQCPLGFSHRGDGALGESLCEGFACRLRSCCKTASISCTCNDAACCSPQGSPPAALRGGRVPWTPSASFVLSEGVRLTLERKWVTNTSQWYYLLASGKVSFAALSEAFGSELSSLSKGYLARLPSKAALAALLSDSTASSFLEFSSDGVARPLWSYELDTESGARTPAAFSWSPGGTLSEVTPVATSDLKYAFLEVVEVFSVLHGADRLLRVVLDEGVSCCYTGEDTTVLKGIPSSLLGATLFLLAGTSDQHNSSGAYTVLTPGGVDATAYALDVMDPYNKHGGLYKAGFEDLGWEEVDAPDLRLEPPTVPNPDPSRSPYLLYVRCWTRTVPAYTSIEVPHGAGLLGALAIAPTSASR